MKKIVLLMAMFMAAALPIRGAVSGQVDWVSRYIWRGFDLLPDNHSALQPSLDVDLGDSGFSLNLWASFALAHRDVFKHSDEIDLTLTYAFKMPEGWELYAGFTNYGYWFQEGFTFKDGTSQELFATLTRTDLPFSPSLSLYYDLNLGNGLYASLGGSREVKLTDKLNLELSGLIGFNARQYIEKTGFSDLDFGAKLPLTLGKATLTPSVNLMIPLMDEVNEKIEFWFGFSAAF